MEEDEKTQNKRPQVWGTQGSQEKFPIATKQPEGTGGSSRLASNNSQRLDRSDWGWRNPFGSVGGEIINRLISQAKTKLNESQECIEWYQRQSEELKKELYELEELQKLHLEALEKQGYPSSQTEEE